MVAFEAPVTIKGPSVLLLSSQTELHTAADRISLTGGLIEAHMAIAPETQQLEANAPGF